jgi:hypothetical protein
MPLKTLLAITLTSAMFLSGCHADARDPKGGPSAGIPKIDPPKKDAPLSAPATPDPAPAALPGGNQEEITDLSLG